MSKIKNMSDIDSMQKKQLKAYISDLEENIKINKELLQNVLMASDFNQASKDLINSLQEENEKMQRIVSKTNAKNSEIFETLTKLQKEKDDFEAYIKDKEKKFET